VVKNPLPPDQFPVDGWKEGGHKKEKKRFRPRSCKVPDEKKTSQGDKARWRGGDP